MANESTTQSAAASTWRAKQVYAMAAICLVVGLAVQMGELGWWHYLNGDYEKAVEMLSAAVRQCPGDLNLSLGLAWAQIEIRRYGVAPQTVNAAIYEQKIQPERETVRAVANRQAQEHDEAMRDFDIALGGVATGAMLLCCGDLKAQKTISASSPPLQQPVLALCPLHPHPDTVLLRR